MKSVHSELCNLKIALEQQLGDIHQRILQKVIDTRWPKRISNTNLHERIKQTARSNKGVQKTT